MKFAELPIGARFNFRERRFQKISPIEAVDVETDKRKVIPRSAKVTRIGEGADAPPPTLPEQLQRASVEAALADYSSQLLAKLQRLNPPLNDAQTAAVATLVQSLHADCIGRLTQPGDAPQTPVAATVSTPAASTTK